MKNITTNMKLWKCKINEAKTDFNIAAPDASSAMNTLKQRVLDDIRRTAIYERIRNITPETYQIDTVYQVLCEVLNEGRDVVTDDDKVTADGKIKVRIPDEKLIEEMDVKVTCSKLHGEQAWEVEK